MKRLTTIVLFFVLAVLSSYGLTQNIIVYSVGRDYLEGCETGSRACKSVTLTRRTLQDSIRIIFPNGGTQSDVYLYAKNSEYLNRLREVITSHPEPLRHDRKFSSQGDLTIDVTGVSDGKYVAQMVSCGFGGHLEIIILTEPEKSCNAFQQTMNLLQGNWLCEQDSLSLLAITNNIWAFNYNGSTHDSFQIIITNKLPEFVLESVEAKFIILRSPTDAIYYEILGLDDSVLSLMHYPSGKRHLYKRKE